MPFKKYKILLFVFVFLSASSAVAQKVGVVLSGGGVAGLAHIGFLKVLEENEIPIDYISGTSAGALIGGMYASGYSLEEIQSYLLSEHYINLAQGILDAKYRFYFKEKEVDASWVNFKLSPGKPIESIIPTNVISPVGLDYAMMEGLSGAAAAAGYNFDSLMIPYRCVAADIESKQQIVFRKGHLSQAIRASMSFPFYLRPIRINERLMFDGGLYNNFPADCIYNDFDPDIIIGNNVAANAAPPDEDNVLSQLKSMLVSKTNYSVICDNGLIVEPKLDDVGTFDFKNAQQALDSGYSAANAKIDAIKRAITRRVKKEDVIKRRAAFNAKKPAMLIDSITITGLNKYQSVYVKKSLRKKNTIVPLKDIKTRYLKIFADDKIKSIYPTATYNLQRKAYDLLLDARREKDIFIEVGGNFSSRPINSAFISGQFNYLSTFAMSLMANSTFGRFYGSTQVKARFDFPIRMPFFIEPEFTLNRWDYFRSQATFFEDVKPSYLLQYETYAGINAGIPALNNSRIKFSYTIGKLTDEYYQDRTFTSTDTADQTFFDFISSGIIYEHNTLNKKFYANHGSYTSFQARFVDGEEYYLPGSTSKINRDHRNLHQWAQVKIVHDNYYKRRGRIRLGFYGEAVFSGQELFNNYTANILRAPAFHPTPESKTLVLESFRAYQYIAAGHKIIIDYNDWLDLRFEGYVFQPYARLIKNEDQTAGLGKGFDQRFLIAMAALVYHSPVGPASISLNYYHNTPEFAQEKTTPLTFLFHFGYIIFNKRALE